MKTAEEYVVSKTGGQTLQTASAPASPPQSSGKESTPQPSLKEAGSKAEIPAIYVAFGPTELLDINHIDWRTQCSSERLSVANLAGVNDPTRHSLDTTTNHHYPPARSTRQCPPPVRCSGRDR